MFAVVGAKLSEGINFADDLARGVLIVGKSVSRSHSEDLCVVTLRRILGIPFPNSDNAELKERMSYVNTLSRSRGSAHDAGKALCMSRPGVLPGRFK
jgi:chromosome transmission fidelity protein 1